MLLGESSFKRLIKESEIQEKVSALGEQIAHDYSDRPLTVLGVLTGSIVLLSDLIQKINLPLRVGLIQASSYRGAAVTAGDLTINSELLPDISNRDVLLVDDIFDSGRTIATLLETVRRKNPNSVRSAVLLKKNS
jgi:hypoxanthine phosphoribosyltransferase